MLSYAKYPKLEKFSFVVQAGYYWLVLHQMFNYKMSKRLFTEKFLIMYAHSNPLHC